LGENSGTESINLGRYAREHENIPIRRHDRATKTKERIRRQGSRTDQNRDIVQVREKVEKEQE
jgi:hypothetical protein